MSHIHHALVMRRDWESGSWELALDLKLQELRPPSPSSLEAVQLVAGHHPRQLSRSHTRLTAARTAEEHAQLVAETEESPARRRGS